MDIVEDNAWIETRRQKEGWIGRTEPTSCLSCYDCRWQDPFLDDKIRWPISYYRTMLPHLRDLNYASDVSADTGARSFIAFNAS